MSTRNPYELLASMLGMDTQTDLMPSPEEKPLSSNGERSISIQIGVKGHGIDTDSDPVLIIGYAEFHNPHDPKMAEFLEAVRTLYGPETPEDEGNQSDDDQDEEDDWDNQDTDWGDEDAEDEEDAEEEENLNNPYPVASRDHYPYYPNLRE